MFDLNEFKDILYFIVDMLIISIHVLIDAIEYITNLYVGQQLDYHNKTALITGSNGGVGRNLCIKLAKRGCNLICLEHPDYEESLEYFRENTLLKLNPNITVFTYYVDLNNLEQVEEYSKKILSKNKIHLSILNAAIHYKEDFLNVETENFMSVLHVNFVSNMILLKYIIRQMITNKDGDIVAISSILSEHGIGNEVAYSASKSAITSLMESANNYCDNKKHDYIRFHTIFPAKIDTPLFSQMIISKYGHYIMPLLTAEYVAQKTIDAISFNYREVYLPFLTAKLFIFVRELIPPKSFNRCLRYVYPF